MKQFIEECRREWKRLRVPAPIADEMAADLAADLNEAEAEGASPEDVLGSGASDARSFAASWAAERGVIPPRSGVRLPRRSLVLAASAALTIVAAVGAALVIFASPDASSPTAAIRLQAPPGPYPTQVWFSNGRLAHAALARGEAELARDHAVLLQARLRQVNGSGVEIHTVGSIVLIVGLVGVILSVPFLFWSTSRRFDAAQS